MIGSHLATVESVAGREGAAAAVNPPCNRYRRKEIQEVTELLSSRFRPVIRVLHLSRLRPVVLLVRFTRSSYSYLQTVFGFATVYGNTGIADIRYQLGGEEAYEW